MTSDFLARVSRAALPFAAIAALAACADIQPSSDPFGPLRAQAEAEQGPLRPTARGGAGAAAMEQPEVRGFVRRGGAVGLPTARVGDAAPRGGGGTVTLNFENADLRDVVRAFLDDGLGAAYVMDPQVQGMVTISSNRALRDDQLLPVLEEILRLNDAALIDGGDVLSIVPRREVGLTAPVLSARQAAARGLTVRVTPLRFVDVEDVRGVLDAFEETSGAITYDPRRNLVFSLGTEDEQRTVAQLLAMLDADAMAGRSFALQPLRFSEPAAIVEEMALIYEGVGRTRFAPVERLNAVLIVTDSPGLIDEAIALVRSFDQIGAETPQMHVFPIENRQADDVAAVLGGLFDLPVDSPSGRASALAPGLTPRVDGEAPAAQDAVAPAQRGGGGGGGGGPGAEGVVRLAVDDASNAVVALATAAGARRIGAAIRRLDAQPLQVMLEATIAEVALNDALEFGVRWFFEEGNFSGTFSDAASGAVGAVFPGFSAVFETADIRAALSALDSITDVRLLSSPTLMVLDNQSARLQVGDQVPVTTRSSTSVTDPEAPIVTETEFRDTGVILELSPRINPNGLVTLRVRQEVSDVLPGADADGNPSFTQRVIESTIAVDSGDTVAIGGLISESASRGRVGLPILSNIPVIGGAFGTTEMTADRSELIVLLTPRVVRDQRDARAATAELRERLQGVFGPPPIVDPITGPRRRALTPGS